MAGIFGGSPYGGGFSANMGGGRGVLGGSGFGSNLRDFIGSDEAMALAQGFMTPGVGTAGAFSAGLGGYTAARKDSRKRAAMNAWIKGKSGLKMTEADKAVLAEYPEIAAKLMGDQMKPAGMDEYGLVPFYGTDAE